MIELLKIAAKALGTYAKTAFKGLLSAGKSFLKSGKNFKNFFKGGKKKLFNQFKRDKDLITNTDDDSKPSLLKITNNVLKDKIKENFDFKNVTERLSDKFKDTLGKAFGVDYNQISEKHRIMDSLRENGVPLSKILEMDKEGQLNAQYIHGEYERLKKESEKMKDLEVLKNQKEMQSFADLIQSKNDDLKEEFKIDDIKLDKVKSKENDIKKVDKDYIENIKKINNKYDNRNFKLEENSYSIINNYS